MGLAVYYWRFIKDFGTISKPLIDLLKKDQRQWDIRAAFAFDKLKNLLSTAPVLALSNFDIPFVLECDASNSADVCNFDPS